MTKNDFYCVALHRGKRITQALRESLLVEAWYLAKSHKKSKRIKGKEHEGSIRIKQDSIYYNGMTGWLFEARFVTEADDVTVDFLVSHNAFKELENADEDRDYAWDEGVFRIKDGDAELEESKSTPSDNPILKAMRGCAAN